MSDQHVTKTATYTTQQTQEMNIHALSGIRAREPNIQAVADLCLRVQGHRDRPAYDISCLIYSLSDQGYIIP